MYALQVTDKLYYCRRMTSKAKCKKVYLHDNIATLLNTFHLKLLVEK